MDAEYYDLCTSSDEDNDEFFYSCEACRPGWFSSLNDETYCHGCASGTYSGHNGSVFCERWYVFRQCGRQCYRPNGAFFSLISATVALVCCSDATGSKFITGALRAISSRGTKINRIETPLPYSNASSVRPTQGAQR